MAQHRLSIAAGLGAILLSVASIIPATAAQDGGTATSPQTESNCPLQRVGEQLVRCDSLTVDGVPATGWVPER